MKQLFLKGPAWAYITPNIDHTKNSHTAWLALWAHYEDESFFKNKRRKHTRLLKASITREKEQRSLPHRYGEPFFEAKKVRDLLTKITDPKLGSAKKAVRINLQYKK
jgi:hypothetical protein